MILAAPDKINLAGQDTGRDHLSPSSLSTQLACLQRAYWHYEARLEPNVRPAALSLGSAFADAIAAGDPELAYKTVLDEHAGYIEAFGSNPWVTVPTTQDAEIAGQTVRCAARAYLQAYGTHNETRELELMAQLRNPATGAYSRTFDLMCRVDAISTDNRVLIEDKLVGQIPRATLSQRLRLDRQVSINAYLVWRCTGVEVEEVRYRMTLKPSIRRKQNESHADYLDRIDDEYDTRPDHYLHEEICHRTPEDFLRLEAELWQWAAARRQARLAGVWPRNTSACHDYGGCRFLPLCSREPGADQQFHEREERVSNEETLSAAA